MGIIILFFLAAVPCFHRSEASPHANEDVFLRSGVETIPPHAPLAAPIRSSVESIPLRNARYEDDERVPLRDAVEKRLILAPDSDSFYKYIEEPDIGLVRQYYGAATLYNSKNTDERLQQGNVNLHEMQQTASGPADRKLVVCYLESWAAYRAPPLAFTPGLVPKTCTHLHYAFATLHPHTYAITATNEDYDVVKGGYRIATGLKRKYQGLKVILSVGGDGSDRLFSEMVQEHSRRRSFINSAVAFLREHDFDGLDLHWTYAGEKSEREREHLTSLLYELREKLNPYGLLLTTVLPPFRYLIEDGYDMNSISGSTDYAILQAWDMSHGKRDEAPSRALQHSPLHRDPGAAFRDQRYENIEFIVKYIIRRGMAPEKLVLGVPVFGRSYTLSASTLPAPGAQVSGWGDEGRYTQTKGLLAYFEICLSESDNKGSSGIDEHGNSYAVFDNQWISYDTPSVVVDKMKFVLSSGLGGAAAWAIDMDDFRGLCGQPFPILSAISTQLNGDSTASVQSSLKTGPCDLSFPYLASDEDSCAHFHFCSGGVNYKIICEDNRLYDPSTGFCGHQDATKCMPGQSLRISVDEAARHLSQAYETDFEWNDHGSKISDAPERLSALESPAQALKKNPDNNKRVVCYMTSWAFYRRSDGKFVPENIDTRLCTHVVYAYATLTPDDLIAKEFDPWADITNNLYERVTSLKDVKVLLGLGGWTDSAGDKYSRLVSSSTARENFIRKIITFLKTHNFKGLHLDWHYPSCWQSNCKKGAKSDKVNFAKFVQELGKALHASDMELGVAVSGYKEVIESAYDLPKLSKAVDFLSAMTYDYHGGWERTTAHHTPITPLKNDALAHYSIDYAVKALLKAGADPNKLNLGLSFYGQSYQLADGGSSNGPGAPAAGPGEAGEFTKQPGMLAYYEICYRVKNLHWKTGRQSNAGPYAYMGNQWVGYDDAKSITEKVEWALRQGLGGVTAWAIDLDDYSNRCCGEPSPLLRAAGRALGRSVPSPPQSACDRPPQPVTPAPPTTTTVASDGSHHVDHNHGSHVHHETTTWPSWSPASTSPTTQQTWWPQSTTTTSTSTTTTTTTTTTRRPVTTTTTTTTSKPSTDYGLDESCEAGTYKPATDDCGSYLQCLGGHWKKNRCAPGLHWHATAIRCDWPSSAKCKETPGSGTSTATTTLAPMTSRPPLSSSTSTTKRPTSTTTRTTTTTTKQPATTTTTSQASIDKEDNLVGSSCHGQNFKPVSGDCNAYLHCDGYQWKIQRCAPGLHWSPKQNHCDWPKYAKCDGSSSKPTYTSTIKPVRPSRPTKPPTGIGSQTEEPKEDGVCSESNSHAPASTCDSYLICVSGRWKKQLCPPGLHWDKRSNRCDWSEFAMCETKTSTMKTPSLTSARPQKRPQTTTTKKPAISNIDEDGIPEPCNTGSYYPHPRCNRFYVCVNGILVAQSCAPGLIWNRERSQCDFPNSASCTDRRTESYTQGKPNQTSMQLTLCNSGEYSMFPGDCTKYRHCLFGRFEEFSCSAGLHWNQEKQICDWPKSAKCKKKNVIAKPTTIKPVSMITKPEQRPQDNYIIQKPLPSEEPSFELPSTATRPELLNSSYKLICYYTNWSWYRPGPGKYEPADIDPSLCTHIIYGFAVLGQDGLIKAHDSWSDYDNGFYKKVIMYKKYGIKVLLAIGGWNDSAGDKYSKLVNNPEARARFVKHVVEFLEEFGFDGLDLDWEYPKCWQVDCSKGPNSDKEGFAALVRELSAVFKPKRLLLSAAVSPNKKVIDAGYDVPVLAKHMDWIAVMTYDYHGQWDKKTGHVAPLYYHPEDDNKYFNSDYTMHYWIKKGAPASKLVMGMPMYGQTFTLGSQWDTPDDIRVRENATGLNVPAVSGGEAGEYTRAKGFLSYYEICDRINNKGWTVVKDPDERIGPYAYKGNQWVSFDDISIIKKKVEFIKSLKLAGGMVWALDLDDFKNRCGQGKHPLINTIKNCLLKDHSTEENLSNKPSIKPQVDDLYDIEVKPSKKPTTTSRPATAQLDVVGSASHDETETYKIVCYYTNFAWYRPGAGKYIPSNIDPSMCTHIVYGFAVLDSDKLLIKPHDSWLDIDNKFYEKVLQLKKHGTKILLGLGGWTDSADDKYSRLVNSPSARRKFIIHTVDYLEQFGFDGLDLDWEYPKCWQAECKKGPNSDKQGFATLVKELKEIFLSRGWLLSAAVSGGKRVIDAGYDVPTLSKNLDWIAVMTYDYHGQWDQKTGHVAPMYASAEDQDETFNANFSINYWIQKGASPNKIVMGMPFYGQSFTLNENVGSGLGVATTAGGEAGDETRARGFLAFYEICERITVRGWKVTRDPSGRLGPYATLEDQWVSFDDDIMIRHKAEYVRAMGLGGGMVWALDLDDFTGKFCGCGKYPLLKTINHVLREKDAPPPCPLYEIQEAPGLTTELDFTVTTKPAEPENEQQINEHEDTDVIDHVHQEDDKEDHNMHPEMIDQGEPNNESSMEGKNCNGIKFAADPNDCSKYYLCHNGEYTQLTCPSQLHWNKNHCDWPARANCKNKALLRLTSDDVGPKLIEDSKILACYFSNWAFYRPTKGSYGPEQVDPAMCTHIIYAWAHLDPYTFKVVPGIPELDIENDFYGKITELKRRGVKVIIGVGGLEDSEGEKWGRLTSSSKNIKTFIDSVKMFLKRWNFDGVQIAWQYPVCKELPCSDILKQIERTHYSDLLSTLSRALRPDYELSAVVPSSAQVAVSALDPEILSETLDWISVAANDYYASKSGRTAYLVELESNRDGTDTSFNATLAYWANVVSLNKLVLSVPGYARSYTLRDTTYNGLHAPVTSPGDPGPFTAVPGFLSYYEICTGLRSKTWKETVDERGAYAVHGLQWASYLKPEQLHRIASSITTGGARGAALWSLDLDDWRGDCGCAHPLLRVIKQGLQDPNLPPTEC